MNATCLGCGATVRTYQSPYALCARCNPKRYVLDGVSVLEDPRGLMKMDLPLPEVRIPAAIVIDPRSKQVGVFDPTEKPLGGWGMIPFHTYRGKVIVDYKNNRAGVVVDKPNVFWRLWNVIRRKRRAAVIVPRDSKPVTPKTSDPSEAPHD